MHYAVTRRQITAVQAEGRRMMGTRRYRRILQLVVEVQVVARELLAKREMERFRKQVGRRSHRSYIYRTALIPRNAHFDVEMLGGGRCLCE